MNKPVQIRVRIAPSPTGYLHIGTARTALFNYLFAKKNKGKFILRIEDTDLERSDPKYEKDIIKGLNWLGIKPDESPDIGGQFGPYRQSERVGLYKKYIKKLLEEKKAFYCFHSEEELKEESRQLIMRKHPPMHNCEFRSLQSEEAETLKETKSNYIIRFKTLAGKTITFKDLVRGEISFDSSLLGDFSIAKKNDLPLYNFAVVADDYDMKISHVIRGEDHLSNTPKQLLIIEALGFNPPKYAHIPLILGLDRSKLSKRNVFVSVEEYKGMYLPEAIFNFLALLGWHPEGDREILSEKEIINEFSLERVQKSGAIFDLEKLKWMNGEYIRKKSAGELTKILMPKLILAGCGKTPQKQLERIVALEQPRLKDLSEIGERTDFYFVEPKYDKELLRWKKMTDGEIINSLDKSINLISNLKPPLTDGVVQNLFFKEIGDKDKGAILWPLRAALTGKKASPGPFDIMEILGMKETLRRLKIARQKAMG